MRSRRKPFLAIVAAFVLVFFACGADNEPRLTASATTTPTAIVTTGPLPQPTSQPTTEPATVTVYFSTGDGTDCGEVSPFTRTLESGEAGLDTALTELLAGPTDAEIANGASSFFSSETATSLEVVTFFPQDHVLVGFHDLASLIPNASTSCGSEALLGQLNGTALQYTERVRYEMQGSCQLFANWLQRECMEYTSEGAEPALLDTGETDG
jgi:hypothetical protein